MLVELVFLPHSAIRDDGRALTHGILWSERRNSFLGRRRPRLNTVRPTTENTSTCLVAITKYNKGTVPWHLRTCNRAFSARPGDRPAFAEAKHSAVVCWSLPRTTHPPRQPLPRDGFTAISSCPFTTHDDAPRNQPTLPGSCESWTTQRLNSSDEPSQHHR